MIKTSDDYDVSNSEIISSQQSCGSNPNWYNDAMHAMYHTNVWSGARQQHVAGSAWHTSCSHQHAKPHRSRVITRIHKALDTQGKKLLSTPGEVTLECLTLLRKPHATIFRAYLEPSSQQQPVQGLEVHGNDGVLLHVGHLNVTETGPLAPLHTHLDAAARRMLPRHLLRRCRVLSSLQLGDTCRQRVTITARTGEEACFVVQLRRSNTEQIPSDSQDSAVGLQTTNMQQPRNLQLAPDPSRQPPISSISHASLNSSQHTSNQQQDEALSPDSPQLLTPTHSHIPANQASRSEVVTSANASGSDDESSCSGIPAPIPSLWRLVSISRDNSNDDSETTTGPHPRLPPELVILQQLSELRAGNVVGAAAYMSQVRESPIAAQTELRGLLRKPSHHVLLTHTSAALLQAGLPSETQFWQHVQLSRRTATGYSNTEYVWQLSLAKSGSWMVNDIISCTDTSTAS